MILNRARRIAEIGVSQSQIAGDSHFSIVKMVIIFPVKLIEYFFHR